MRVCVYSVFGVGVRVGKCLILRPIFREWNALTIPFWVALTHRTTAPSCFRCTSSLSLSLFPTHSPSHFFLSFNFFHFSLTSILEVFFIFHFSTLYLTLYADTLDRFASNTPTAPRTRTRSPLPQLRSVCMCVCVCVSFCVFIEVIITFLYDFALFQLYDSCYRAKRLATIFDDLTFWREIRSDGNLFAKHVTLYTHRFQNHWRRKWGLELYLDRDWETEKVKQSGRERKRWRRINPSL